MQIVLLNFHGNKPNPVYEVLAQALRRRGHDVIVAQYDGKDHLLWQNGEGDELSRIQVRKPSETIRGVPFLPKMVTLGSRFTAMLSVRDLLNDLQPDIVQVNTDYFPRILPPLSPSRTHYAFDIRQINESVVNSSRARLREYRQARTWRALATSVYDHTFFCHEEAARRIVGEDWPEYASVIPVGVDNAFLEIEDQRLLRPSDNEPVRFIYIGTLSRLRNLNQLIYAAKILLKSEQSFRIDFVGPDRSNGGYQKTVEELGLEEFVSILPPIPYDAVAEFLTGYHVGLAYVPDRPTWHYQPTIKIKEYRALGLPILSTDVASHRGIVEDGRNGVMVQDTPESIAAGMRRFVSDRPFLDKAIDSARALRAGQNWDDIAAMYEDVYQRLLQDS